MDIQSVLIPSEDYKKIIRHVPISTVDVVIFNTLKDQVFLFHRTNRPAQGTFYSVGGRMYKGETMLETAKRKLREEAGISKIRANLVFGGVMDEFFEDSLFQDVSMHCVNVYFGYVCNEEDTHFDESQFDGAKWFHVDDPSIHSYVQEKIQLLQEKI